MNAKNDFFEDYKILLIGDETDSRSLIRKMLEGYGIIQIFEVADKEEALRFIESSFDFINMVICDWSIRGMNGIEFLHQLRQFDPNFPFVIVTGHCDKDSVHKAINAGVSAYIKKPFSPAQLESKLRIIKKRCVLA